MAFSALEAVTGDVAREFGVTRKLLSRVPDDHLSWKPHEKSMSLAQLGAHLSNLMFWYVKTAQQDELDLSTVPPSGEPPASTEALLEAFDTQSEQVHEALAALSEDDLDRSWTLRHGDHVVFSQPKAEVIRIWCTNHLVHHRGQLSVYLRLLDVPLPMIYGPSADERH